MDGSNMAGAPVVLHGAYRWLQLAMGVVCMAMIANLQYGWTLFVNPIDTKYHWGQAAIQVAFTIFVFTETWLVPIEGWFVDRFGPAIVVLLGGLFVAAAWAMNSQADSLWMLYAGAIVGGIGASAVYGTCVGNALKWFPDHRGLAAGITAAGFGAGAAVTVVPIAAMIKSSGYEAAFLWFGLGQGAIIVAMSLFLRRPPKGLVAPVRKGGSAAVDVAPGQVLATPVFWLMYVMMVLVASGGLMAAAQIAPIAKDYKIADVPVNSLGLVGAALTMAISLDRIFDGVGRPFFGWVSDRIGRENTMTIAFSLGAASLLTLANFGHEPIVFVLASALFFGVFGEIYSLFPATAGDTFGSKFATTNNGMLYTAKGTASLLVPLASVVAASYGWSAVFGISVVANLIAAALALFVLKPMRRRFIARMAEAATGSSNARPAVTPVAHQTSAPSAPAAPAFAPAQPSVGFEALPVAAARGYASSHAAPPASALASELPQRIAAIESELRRQGQILDELHSKLVAT